MSNHSVIARVLAGPTYRMYRKLCTFFSLEPLAVAFRWVKKILKHRCEPLIPNYTDKSDQSHVDADPQSALMTML